MKKFNLEPIGKLFISLLLIASIANGTVLAVNAKPLRPSPTTTTEPTTTTQTPTTTTTPTTTPTTTTEQSPTTPTPTTETQQPTLPATPVTEPVLTETTNPLFTMTTDSVNYNLISSKSANYISGYSFSDWVPLADGWMIIGDTSMNKVIILNVITGEVAQQYQLTSAPTMLDVDFEKGFVYATQRSTNKLAKINVNTNQVTYITTSGSNIDVAVGENNIVFTAARSEFHSTMVSIIDAQQNREVNTYNLGQKADFLAYNKGLSNLILAEQGTSPSSLIRCAYDPVSKSLSLVQQVRDMGENGRELTISNDLKHIAFAAGGGNGEGYTIFDIDSSNLTNNFGEWNTGAYPTAVAFSPDNQYLIASDSHQIQVFDMNTHVLLKSKTLSTGIVGVSRGSKIIYAYNGGKIYYYALDTLGDLGTNSTLPVNNSVSTIVLTINKPVMFV
ncbi:MAG TPA: hypothetical protein VHS59_12295, partial [Bacillota bacterium]|nr:hypothetical protein [Bacillota bacterium]